MSTIDLSISEGAVGLERFFSSLDECKDKNEFTHGLHPYPAKFIPHIPRELIRTYTRPGELVWDPMTGSGTTLVEAALEGRRAVGGDLNPIAALVSRAKTTLLSPAEKRELNLLKEQLIQYSNDGFDGPVPEPPDFRNRDHWFSEEVTSELSVAKLLIDRLESAASRDFALCGLSALIVSVSNQESETRWRAIPRPAKKGEVFRRFAEWLARSLVKIEAFSIAARERVEVRLEDARFADLAPGSVDLVVTSPPYANSHDYYLYNKLRLFWLGYEVEPVQSAEIGSRNRHSDRNEGIDCYLDAMESVFDRVREALVPRGRAVIVVADSVIRGEFFDMGELMPKRAAKAGLSVDQGFGFDHRRFNTTFQRGFGTRKDKITHVLVFQKPS